MKRFAAILLILLFIPLCSCSIGIDEVLQDLGIIDGDNTYSDEPQLSGGIVKIKPGAVNLPSGGLSAYNQLSGVQKNLYSIMLTAIADMELRNIDVTDYASKDTFSDAVAAHRALLCDRPDIFWMPKTFSVLSIQGEDNKYIVFKDHFSEDNDTGYYGITREQKDIMQSELTAVTNDIKQKAAGLNTAFEKELFLHDYICEHVTYDSVSADDPKNANRDSITAYGALVKGSAICEGYSKAMQYLCVEFGIPCSVVYGEHDNVSHMWNIVNPGDGEYYLDVTFDDSSESSIMHVYFNVTKEKLLKTHIFDESFVLNKTYDNTDSFNFFNIDCKNTAFNYFVKTGAYIKDDCTAAISVINKARLEGKNSTELLNKTGLPVADAFMRLRRKAAGIAISDRYYSYESENIIIVTW